MAAWARDLLGLERLGHGGTLDPFATGVLPLMTGRCMKITNKNPEASKNPTSPFFDSERCPTNTR